MHGMLIQSDSVSLAAISLMSIWNAVWPYLAMFFGFSAIIFVHELGHFLVAKWAGVRVEQFAIGFGKELVGFTKGETRYSLNLLPLGGYVKMLGQEDFDDKSKELKFGDDPRSFVNKPVFHRMAIVSAGVIMNVLLACILFMAVFMIGMDVMGTKIAFVEPDSPADKSGLLPGDDIKKINGSSIQEFNEVMMAITLAPPLEPIEFLVQRDGEEDLKRIEVTPEANIELGKLMIGLAPGRTRTIATVGPELATMKEGFPRVGDVLVEIDGREVTDENINHTRQLLPYAKSVIVERSSPADPDAPPERLEVTIPPLLQMYPSDRHDPNSFNLLGLSPLVKVSYLDPKGRAYACGLEVGDTVLSWDDAKYPTPGQIVQSVRDNAERDIEYTVRKSDGRRVQAFVRPSSKKQGGTIQAVCRGIDGATEDRSEPRARFESVVRGGVAESVGIEPGDIVVKWRDIENPSASEVAMSVSRGLGETIPITILKADGRKVPTYVVPTNSGTVKAGFALIAQDLLRVGQVVESIDGKPSPAFKAGIPKGARIKAVNGQTVSRWGELVERFQENAGTSVQLEYLDDQNQAHAVSFDVPHCVRTMLGVGPESRILSIGGDEKVEMEFSQWRGVEKVAVNYPLGTREKLRELIGQKQVPVVYRENHLAEAKTAYIDVTEEMIDPWLSRIKLAANVEVGIAFVPLKGENALDSIAIGLHKTYYFVVQVYQTINRMLFSRSVGVENISGPLGIVAIGGRMAEAGLTEFLFFMAIISANLAVLNFLPLPIVDGGLMVFLIIEKIKGSPVSIQIQMATQMFGIFLLLAAFVYVTFNDVIRIFG